MTNPLFIRLSSCGNPDFGENPAEILSPLEIKECSSLPECVKEAILYRTAYNLGSGNWNGGQIFHSIDDALNGTDSVYWISYNGRVWEGKKFDSRGNVNYQPKEVLV